MVDKADDPGFISKSDFRSRFGIKDRVVTLKTTGDRFKIRTLNMTQKRQIREDNIRLKFGLGKQSAVDNSAELDVEGLTVDTIIAACQEPKFSESDRDWMLNSIDSTLIQELYEAIDTPVKISSLTDEKLGN